ncbi:MAG: type II toxin-antitoxin system YafQ family toxin [Pseudomonadota bacterium]
MRTIERSTSFKRDYKRESRGKHRKTLKTVLTDILMHLVSDKSLDIQYRDHDLSGNWCGYRECHVKPDLLLIYRKVGNEILRLARLGSHSKLFR